MPLNMKYASITAVLITAVLLVGCGGGAVPSVTQKAPPVSTPGTGHVFIRFSKLGSDVEEAGDVLRPHIEKALRAANIKVSPAETGAEYLVHGTISIKCLETTRRMGLDIHKYAAHATWQVARRTGYSVLKRETTAEGTGKGRAEALGKTFTSLAGKITADALPKLQQLLANK